MAVINRGTARNSYSSDKVSKIKEFIGSHAKTYFSSTLGTEKDIVNIITAQFFLESRFNTNAIGPALSNRESRNYLSSSAVQAILTEGNATEQANIQQGLRVIGLGQVSGHYLVRRGTPSGKGEVERLRPDLATLVCVEPGEDLFAKILGEDNMSNAILASMIILESKYKNVASAGGAYFKSIGDRSSNTYPSKISAAIAGYLGLGASDVNGTTPVAYASSIVGGAIYSRANGSAPSIYESGIRELAALSAGPTTNGSSRAKISTPGCA